MVNVLWEFFYGLASEMSASNITTSTATAARLAEDLREYQLRLRRAGLLELLRGRIAQEAIIRHRRSYKDSLANCRYSEANVGHYVSCIPVNAFIGLLRFLSTSELRELISLEPEIEGVAALFENRRLEYTWVNFYQYLLDTMEQPLWALKLLNGSYLTFTSRRC
jgi:hypothetical protein